MEKGLLGKVFGIVKLGYFDRAKSLQSMPVMLPMTVFNKVLFPVFSKLQDAKESFVALLSKAKDRKSVV